MPSFTARLGAVAVVLLALSMPLTASAASGDLHCQMRFSMSGWSLFYKTAKGSGVVTCNDGQTLRVRLTSTGGGLTVGKSSIDDGHGTFTGVRDIRDVLGSYAAGTAHAGAVDSASAAVVTKGEISLAISGKGRGWDLGVDFSKFTIKPAQ